MNILVTGATGYIGSHTCVELLDAGYTVIGIDNFSNSKREVLDYMEQITSKKITFYEGDMTDGDFVERVFADNHIDCVIHFAALKAVGESVEEPARYYNNNINAVLRLCEAMERHDVKKIIFSSSACVYGAQEQVPFLETFPVTAVNPYGRTKLMGEGILSDMAVAHSDWSVVILRYFNPIGAHQSGLIGEDPQGIPNNLMPYILKVAIGEYPQLSIFGDDYPTEDGTCIRDYIHVVDLAQGHVKAIEQTTRANGVHIYNLGIGRGVSVKEIVAAFERVTGVTIPNVIAPRRSGDVPIMCAGVERAKTELDWVAQRTLDDMCRDSWHFAQVRLRKS